MYIIDAGLPNLCGSTEYALVADHFLDTKRRDASSVHVDWVCLCLLQLAKQLDYFNVALMGCRAQWILSILQRVVIVHSGFERNGLLTHSMAH